MTDDKDFDPATLRGEVWKAKSPVIADILGIASLAFNTRTDDNVPPKYTDTDVFISDGSDHAPVIGHLRMEDCSDLLGEYDSNGDKVPPSLKMFTVQIANTVLDTNGDPVYLTMLSVIYDTKTGTLIPLDPPSFTAAFNARADSASNNQQEWTLEFPDGNTVSMTDDEAQQLISSGYRSDYGSMTVYPLVDHSPRVKYVSDKDYSGDGFSSEGNPPVTDVSDITEALELADQAVTTEVYNYRHIHSLAVWAFHNQQDKS